MGKIVKILAYIRKVFFSLNEKQRTHIATLFDKLAIGALLPVAIRLMSDGKSGDGFPIFVWLLCAIVFEIIAVVALTAKE